MRESIKSKSVVMAGEESNSIRCEGCLREYKTTKEDRDNGYFVCDLFDDNRQKLCNYYNGIPLNAKKESSSSQKLILLGASVLALLALSAYTIFKIYKSPEDTTTTNVEQDSLVHEPRESIIYNAFLKYSDDLNRLHLDSILNLSEDFTMDIEPNNQPGLFIEYGLDDFESLVRSHREDGGLIEIDTVYDPTRNGNDEIEKLVVKLK